MSAVQRNYDVEDITIQKCCCSLQHPPNYTSDTFLMVLQEKDHQCI